MESIFKTNYYTRCERSWYCLLPVFLLGALSSRIAALPLTNKLRPSARRVLSAARAGLLVANGNGRTLLGLGLILVAAPLAGVAYQGFDITSVDHAWYYRTWFDFLGAIGPQLTVIIALTGASLLFRQDSRKAYFLLPPLTLYVTKVLWLIQVSSNEEFNNFLRLAPYYFFLTGAIMSVMIIFTFNYLTTLHFHRRWGVLSRILGIIGLSEKYLINDSEAIDMLRDQLKAYNSLP